MAGSMVRQTVWILTLVVVLGSALAAGVCFAFSNFIMKALGAIPSAQGMAAMRSINVTVINPLFMTILFGTAAACLPLLLYGMRSLRQPGMGWVVAGSLFYLVGAILVTAAFNVPLNDQLAAIHPGAADAEFWSRYRLGWTAWNHVRTYSSLLACLAFVMALCRLPRLG